MDGQAKCTIKTLEDMLRACVMDFKRNWDDHIHLIEIPSNNSHHSIIQMASYEALYGYICKNLIGWFEIGEAWLIGPHLSHQSMDKVKVSKDMFRMA